MRIMIATDQYPPMIGGVPTATHTLATALARRGHQVVVVAPSQDLHDSNGIEQKVRVYRFSSFEWPTYKDQRISFLPFLPVHNLIKRYDPDIIHIHSPIVLGNIAQMLAGGLRKPVVVTNHYLPINMHRSLNTDSFVGRHFSNLSYSYLVSFCNRCEYVTAPTMTALNLLYEHGLRAPAAPISNGIDLTEFSPGERDLQILQHFGLPTDRPLIIHVNRLSEEKRVDVLLNAMAQTQGNSHLALAGSGPAAADLRALAQRLKITDQVSFLGFVPDAELLALRRSADLFVIPSEAELQSIATMEAMACGLPVIAADSYALPELVHDGENGFLFQPGNSAQFAQQIDLLLNDADQRIRMGEESLKIIAAHDSSKILEQWEALYQRLSVEFKDLKGRRRLARRARHYPRSTPAESHPIKLPHIRRTGDLSLDPLTSSDVDL